MPAGSTCHGPPPSRKREGIAQNEHPQGETFNESPLRRTRPYVHMRGSLASMALERLPPVCVAGRGDGIHGGATDGRQEGGYDNADGWERAMFMKWVHPGG